MVSVTVCRVHAPVPLDSVELAPPDNNVIELVPMFGPGVHPGNLGSNLKDRKKIHSATPKPTPKLNTELMRKHEYAK